MIAKLRSRWRRGTEADSRSRRVAEAGTTLIEVLLASTLMVASMTVVGTTIEGLVHHDVEVTNEVQALDGIQGAMEVTTHDLHAGVAPSTGVAAFTTATATNATFTAALGGQNGPDLVTMSLTGSGSKGVFTVTRVPADPGSAPKYTWTGKQLLQVALHDVVTNGAAPLFTYYNYAGTVIASPVSTLSSIAQVAVDIAAVVGGQQVELSYKVDVFNIVYANSAGSS